MDILFTIYRGLGYGGSEVSALNSARALKKLGHKVLIASTEDFPDIKTIKFRKFHRILRLSRYHEIYLSNFLADLIKKEKIDVVHAQDRLTSVPAVIAAKRCGVPVVVHFRDYWFACPRSSLIKPNMQICSTCSFWKLAGCSPLRLPWETYKLRYIKRVRSILKDADARIAISSATKEKLSKFSLDSEIVPNSVEYDFLKNVDKSLKRELKINKIMVTYIGMLSYNKGIMELLGVMTRLLRQNKNLGFLIVGDGPQKSEIKQKIRKERLSNSSVLLTGSLPYSLMSAVYAASDIIAIPSIWDEPFGRVAIEAMAAGKPVIASATGGLKDIIKDKNYLVHVFDSNAWYEKLGFLIKNSAARKNIGLKNKKYAQTYTPDKIAKQVLKIYGRLANAK